MRAMINLSWIGVNSLRKRNKGPTSIFNNYGLLDIGAIVRNLGV